MKIQILGLGVVGTAQAFLCKKLGHEVFGYDIKPVSSEFAEVTGEIIPDVDITFICTNENSVEQALIRLIENKVQGLYVIKSTVLPETTKNLMKKYQTHISHNPEFLREKYAFEDVLHPNRIIVGQCCEKHGEMLRKIYSPLKTPIFITDPTTSEMVKIVTNSLRATMISFWNEICFLSQKLGININEVSKLVNLPKALGEWEGGGWGTKFFGKPFGGKCLPKDLDNLISTFHFTGLNPILFEAVKEFNAMLGGETDDN